MTRSEAEQLLVAETTSWLDDPDSDVVWVGRHEGRWGLRMRQSVREATTVWFEIGALTVSAEAYLLPAPPLDAGDAYRLCLARNRRSWPVATFVDSSGDIFVGGRIPVASFDETSLGQVVGAIYQVVESTFRPLIRAAFASREKPS